MPIQILNHIEQIFQLDFSDSLVLTSSNSLAYELRQLLTQQQLEKQAVFELPQIMSYGRGIQQLYRQSILFLDEQSLKFVLDDFSIQYLWRQVIQHAAPQLLDLSGTATAAKNAHYLQEQWQVSVDELDTTVEYEQFKQWKQDYMALLNQYHCVDQVGLIQLLTALLKMGKIKPPKHIVLYGLQVFNHLDQAFFQALTAQGSQVYQIQLPLKALENPVLIAYENFEQELEAVLGQIARMHTEDPTARFLVLSANLDQNLFAIHRKASLLIGQQYHCSVGQDLSDWPLVKHVLKIFEFLATLSLKKSVPKQLLGEAILATKVCRIEGVSFSQCLEWDYKIRKHQKAQYGLEELMTWLTSYSVELAQQWQELISAWQQSKYTVSAWVELVYQTLEALGFPNDHFNHTHHYQVSQAFYDALYQFRQLGLVVSDDSALSMLNLFSLYLSNVPFQVQREKGTFVFFSELSNIPEGKWKGVWVIGLDDGTLPLSSPVNHLLPILSQQKAGVPQVDMDVQMQRSEQLLQHVYHIAEQVHLSYHSLDTKNNELRPTPMVSEVLPARLCSKTPVSKDAYIQRYQEPLYLKDLQGDFLYQKSGYQVLEYQAVSPLEGFARYHLNLSPMRSYEKTSLNMLRGNFTHAVMQKIWEYLKTKQALEDLSDLALKEKISHIAHQEAWIFKGQVSDEVRDYEVNRAIELAYNSLQDDRENGQFSEVLCEQKIQWSYKNICLNLRIDRIDEDRNGLLTVYDYKTSKNIDTKRLSWFKDSLKEISFQLPLYVVAVGENARGMAYYHLQPMAFAKGEQKLGLRQNEARQLERLGKSRHTYQMSMQDFRQWYEKYFQVLLTQLTQYYVSNPPVEQSELKAFLRQGDER